MYQVLREVFTCYLLCSLHEHYHLHITTELGMEAQRRMVSVLSGREECTP